MWIPKEEKGGMSISSIFYAIQFSNYLNGKEFDYAIIRGDRYELLFLTAICAYRGIPIIHIEAGDQSGVVDNKIRHAISHLSDYHFATNEESLRRLVNMGLPMSKIYNFGSLDVEFANEVKPKQIHKKPYIFCAYHGIEGEDEGELNRALERFEDYDIIRAKGNGDYNKEYPAEYFEPEDYINLMRGAKVCVGNSSSLIKEASILEVGVVLVGDRQKNRLLPNNVLTVPCEEEKIKLAIDFQMGNKHKRDLIYFQEGTSKNICNQLKKLSQESTQI